MKRFQIVIVSVIFVLSITSCDQLLDYEPKGTVGEQALESPMGAEGLVTAAYAALGNDNWFVPYTYPWAMGSVRAEDTFKGGLSTSDQAQFHKWEMFAPLLTDNPHNNRLWERLYIGVSRANDAMRKIKSLSEDEYPKKKQRLAEMRFVRGYFYFKLKRLYKHIPWIDESDNRDDITDISNRELSSQELWDNIAADFQAGVDDLPMSTEDRGRADGFAAKAFLARTLLYSAYEQNDKNQVVNINKEKLKQVVQHTSDVIDSGKFHLVDDFAKDYLWKFEGNSESIFSIIHTREDGSNNENLEMAKILNYPVTPEYACCSFNRPTVTMANAFQTSQGGVPKFDTYNDVENTTNEDFQNRTFDVRLGHTIPIPGEPFKYQTDYLYEPDAFVRTQQLYGPFTDVKSVQPFDCGCLESVDLGYVSSKDDPVLRYDDLLLWKAEALIQLGRQQEALPIINKIRKRAMGSTQRLKDADGNLIANFSMDLYHDGQNISWTQENAMRALRWERWLEFATEGVRFFDLTRWGIAAEKINKYFSVEQTRFPFLSNGHFTKGKHEYMPIPEQQIDFSDGVYKQNPGY